MTQLPLNVVRILTQSQPRQGDLGPFLVDYLLLGFYFICGCLFKRSPVILSIGIVFPGHSHKLNRIRIIEFVNLLQCRRLSPTPFIPSTLHSVVAGQGRWLCFRETAIQGKSHLGQVLFTRFAVVMSYKSVATPDATLCCDLVLLNFGPAARWIAWSAVVGPLPRRRGTLVRSVPLL